MRMERVCVILSALAALVACSNRGAENRSGAPPAGGNAVAAAPAEAAAATSAATPSEPQEILCHMGMCTYLRIDRQETVREANGERLLRVTSAEGSHPISADAEDPPANIRDRPIQWSPQPNNYYVLCSATRPTLIIQKEAPARGWEGILLPFVSGLNFASMDLFIHYSAACHPGETVDDGFARRHGFRDVQGDRFDLARPEDALNPRT